MKRSEINQFQREAVAFFDAHRFRLPSFAFWTPETWAEMGTAVDEIRHCGLGWDLTDFGSGDFRAVGLLLFTVRNGNVHDDENRKAYAEKIMIVKQDQETPWHYHSMKMEDIINRGGGDLVIELCESDREGHLMEEKVHVSVDGRRCELEPRAQITLKPGESVTLQSGLAHQFYGRGGTVLVGEVSSVNEDATDNYFIPPRGRFPSIDEDEPPLYLLCNEYPRGS